MFNPTGKDLADLCGDRLYFKYLHPMLERDFVLPYSTGAFIKQFVEYFFFLPIPNGGIPVSNHCEHHYMGKAEFFIRVRWQERISLYVANGVLNNHKAQGNKTYELALKPLDGGDWFYLQVRDMHEAVINIKEYLDKCIDKSSSMV